MRVLRRASGVPFPDGGRVSAPAMLVSAGAGTGKTYWIVEYVCERVFTGLPIERIAAVTFTEAAAAELQDRIRARLLDSPEFAPQASRVDAAAICTIHGFALTLLERYPLAAGVPPKPLVLQPGQCRAMLRALIADLLRGADMGWLRKLLYQALGPGLGLSARGRSDKETPTGRLTDLVEQVIEKSRSLGMRATALRAEGERAAERLVRAMGPTGDTARLRDSFARALDDALAFVAENPEPPTKSDQRLYEVLRSIAETSLGENDWVDAAVRIAVLGPGAYGKRKFKAAEPLCDAAASVVRAHPEIRARLDACVRGVFAAAAKVLEGYEAEKTRIGAVDFEDMQVAALELLRGTGPAGVAYASLVARALPVVVVDEFQDTSPLQFQLFEELRVHGAEVVYVGDLKQGIYGFRTADSALFSALLEEASARAEGHRELSTSRRSRPELVAFVNDLFGAAMPPRGLAFAPLGVDNAYCEGRCPKISPSIDVVRHPPTGKAAKQRATIDRLRELIEGGSLRVLDRVRGEPRPARWGDVALIGYKNADLSDWSAALRARGIATVLDEGELFDALEVQLALAWLRMLASPRDRAAAASVLLSELYGIAQRTMVRMTLAGVVGSPSRALDLATRDPGMLPLTSFERRALERCARDLTECRRAMRHLPLPEAVEVALERVDLALRLALKTDAVGASRVRANLRRICELTHEFAERAERSLALDGDSGITLENLLAYLERARELHYKQPAGEAGPDALRLVTIHASKGLEYPIVVLDVLSEKLEVKLPRVEVERPTSRSELLARDALARSGVRLVPDVGMPALRDELAALFESDVAQSQEWLRLLYVAVTRAREHLVLLWPEDTKSTSTVRRVKDLVVNAVPQPPQAAGEGGWVLRPGGTAHAVFVLHASSGEDEKCDDEISARTAELDGLDAIRAELEADSVVPEPFGSALASRESPRLSFASPTDFCRVADCPEVPRLSAMYPDEHALARMMGESACCEPIPSTRSERASLPDDIEPARLGKLLHQALERADLLGCGDDTDRVRALLARRGVSDDRVTDFIARSITSVRAALACLGAREVVGHEIPFAVQVAGTLVRGAIDLVVRSPRGLHVIDFKSHPLPPDALPRWIGYYRPQLDLYALALAKITGERIAGRHLILPAAGILATLDAVFDPTETEAQMAKLSVLLAAEVRGPGPANDCARCGWLPRCARGQGLAAPGHEGWESHAESACDTPFS